MFMRLSQKLAALSHIQWEKQSRVLLCLYSPARTVSSTWLAHSTLTALMHRLSYSETIRPKPLKILLLIFRKQSAAHRFLHLPADSAQATNLTVPVNSL